MIADLSPFVLRSASTRVLDTIHAFALARALTVQRTCCLGGTVEGTQPEFAHVHPVRAPGNHPQAPGLNLFRSAFVTRIVLLRRKQARRKGSSPI